MTKSTAFLLLYLCCFANVVLAQAPTAEFDRMFEEHFKPNTPGATVLVAQAGRIVYHKAFGLANLEAQTPMRTDHVFRIGSITKQFTAVAILQLVEQGKLSLKDTLTKFIPDYPTHGKTIRVEHLLTHTSGIKSYTDMEEWDAEVHRKDFTPTELIDYFKNQPMDFDPDAKWKYNNSGYILLGYIIEKVSGLTYGDYITQRIFKPLGMKNSYYGTAESTVANRALGYTQNEADSTYAPAAPLSMTQPYAAGSLLSTVEDLYIWTTALHSGKVLQPKSMKGLLFPYYLPSGVNTNYAYGLRVGNLLGTLTSEHSGGIHGFLSDMMYLPNEQVCVVILTNCDCEPPRGLTPKLAAMTSGKEVDPKPIKLKTSELEKYVGVYERERTEQRYITLEDGQLYSMRKGSSKFKITPYAPDQFFFEDPFARITFLRKQEGGRESTLAIVSDRTSDESLWEKTDKPLPVMRPEMKLTEAQLEKFVGAYQLSPEFTITVTREGTQLFCQATGQQRFEVFATTANRFFLKVVDAEIEFYADETTGSVTKLVLFQGGQEMPGERVK